MGNKEVKFSIGDPVVVKVEDFYGGIEGNIKEESPLNHSVLCYIISITDSTEFCKEFPKDKVGNNTLEKVYGTKELTIAHYNLSHNKDIIRERRLNKLLGDGI